MMKTIIRFLTYSMMAFALVFTSCDGEDGMDGAEGPQGEQGVDGQDGEDGNAEVMYSDWIPADFTGTASFRKFMKIDFPPELPAAFDIKDTHIILVYFTGFGDGNIYLLPVLDFRGAQFTYGYGSAANGNSDINLTALALNGDLTEFQIDPDRGARFRYVIIPPNISLGKSSIDYNDYEAVKNLYNLKD